jgi:hypothetical protein
MIQNIYKTIAKVIPKNVKWFIAGGSLRSGRYNDIDIFFYSEEDYKTAKNAFDHNSNSHFCVDTKNATTYVCHVPSPSSKYAKTKDVQLIKQQFGTPKQVISNFDLNHSMKALTYNNNTITLYDDNTLKFNESNLSSNSFARYVKYLRDKDSITTEEYLKQIIDKYSGSTAMLPPSYEQESPKPANLAMYKAFKNYLKDYNPPMYDYLIQQIQLQSPELLL